MTAAEKLDYSVSRSAAALKSGQSFRIALLASETITTWFNANIFAGLDSALRPSGNRHVHMLQSLHFSRLNVEGADNHRIRTRSQWAWPPGTWYWMPLRASQSNRHSYGRTLR